MIAAIVLSPTDSALPCHLADLFPDEEVLGLWLTAPGDDWTGDNALIFRPEGDTPSPRDVARSLLPHLAGTNPDGICLRDGNLQRETAAALAAKLGGPCLTGCDAVRRDPSGKLEVTLKPFAGRGEARLQVLRPPLVATLREPQDPPGVPARPAQPPKAALWQSSTASPWTTVERRASQVAGIDMARYIVSGGLGLGSRDSFERLRPLAERLEAGVGATLAAVEAGWATVELQIGQTGNAVHPDIYVAIGISGAPQHVSGVNARHMLAVNKDPGAPIFHVADVGVVGDATRFLEALTQALAEG